MNLTVFAAGDGVFMNCECIKGYTFKMVAPREKSARLTIAENALDTVERTAIAAKVQEKWALLVAGVNREQGKSDRMAANYAKLQDKSVQMTVLNASCLVNIS